MEQSGLGNIGVKYKTGVLVHFTETVDTKHCVVFVNYVPVLSGPGCSAMLELLRSFTALR